jgi:hypothetical protein
MQQKSVFMAFSPPEKPESAIRAKLSGKKQP